MTKKLSEFHVGDIGTVTAVNGGGAIKRRLMDMGVTLGVTVTLKKTAPLGDPLEISLRGYSLSLRKAEAENIILEVK